MTAATTTSDVAGQRWKYEFDAIGNRTRAETGLTSKPMVTRYTPATGDATQYATVQHPVTTVTSGQESVSAVWGQVFRTGSSGPTAQPDTAPATVTLEGGTDVTDTTVRTTGEPGSFRREFALGSETQAQRRKLTVTAADASSQSRTQTRWVDIPPQTEALTYDEDGNLTQDARWTYVWDAENRLIEMRENPGMPWFAPSATGAPRALKLVMEYDAYSRRVGKKVYQWQGPSTTGSWQPQSYTVYVYDGWNLVAELDGLNARSVVRTYVWGADLSGSKQGAGGVGGLLLVRSHFRADDGSQSGTRYQIHSDANGNVMSLLALDGANAKRVVGRFDYDAFGNRITNTLPPELGDVCPVGFSSKFTDKETGHVYYGYRILIPELGRWANRDPLGERGGINLYGMVGNDAVNEVDVLGLARKEKRDCIWTLYISHADEAVETLDELLGQGKQPGSDCGDNKYGFASCAGDHLNSLVPANQQLPVSPDNSKPMSDDELKHLNDALDKAGLPKPKKRPNNRRENPGVDLAILNAWVEDAKKQCDNKNNCCATINISASCSPEMAAGNRDRPANKDPCRFAEQVRCKK